MLKDEPAPGRKNLWRLWQKSQKRLKPVHVAGGLLWSEAKAVYVCRTGRHVPELDEILRKTEQLLPWW